MCRSISLRVVKLVGIGPRSGVSGFVRSVKPCFSAFLPCWTSIVSWLLFRELVGLKTDSRLYQRCRVNIGKQSEIIIFGSLLTTFEESNIFGGSCSKSKNCLNQQIKSILSKSLIHTVKGILWLMWLGNLALQLQKHRHLRSAFFKSKYVMKVTLVNLTVFHRCFDWNYQRLRL